MSRLELNCFTPVIMHLAVLIIGLGGGGLKTYIYSSILFQAKLRVCAEPYQQAGVRCVIFISMKTKLSLLALGLAMVAGVGAGCQPENAGVDPAYMKTAEEAGKVNREIFVKVGGDYDKMTPEDRAKFLANFKNDEAQAKRFGTS